MDEYRRKLPPGLRAVLRRPHPDLTASRAASKWATEAMCHLCRALAEETAAAAPRATGKKGAAAPRTGVDAALCAVRTVLPPEMARFAEGAISMHLTKYGAGLLLYDAKAPAPRQKRVVGPAGDLVRQPQPVQLRKEFVKCVPTLVSAVDAEGNLDANAKRLLAMILQLLAAKIISQAQELCRGSGSLTIKHIVSVVNENFAPNMAIHANAQFNRIAFLASGSTVKRELDSIAARRTKRKKTK